MHVSSLRVDFACLGTAWQGPTLQAGAEHRQRLPRPSPVLWRRPVPAASLGPSPPLKPCPPAFLAPPPPPLFRSCSYTPAVLEPLGNWSTWVSTPSVATCADATLTPDQAAACRACRRQRTERGCLATAARTYHGADTYSCTWQARRGGVKTVHAELGVNSPNNLAFEMGARHRGQGASRGRRHGCGHGERRRARLPACLPTCVRAHASRLARLHTTQCALSTSPAGSAADDTCEVEVEWVGALAPPRGAYASARADAYASARVSLSLTGPSAATASGQLPEGLQPSDDCTLLGHKRACRTRLRRRAGTTVAYMGRLVWTQARRLAAVQARLRRLRWGCAHARAAPVPRPALRRCCCAPHAGSLGDAPPSPAPLLTESRH